MLKLFGAKIGSRVRVYPSCRIWAPWNLTVEDNSSVGDFVDCYSVATIKIGKNSIISQYSYICSATHDYNEKTFPLIPKEITIGDGVWVAAGAYIGPGVKINDSAIVGAKACVYKDIPEGAIVGGNPAKIIKHRPSAKSQALSV